MAPSYLRKRQWIWHDTHLAHDSCCQLLGFGDECGRSVLWLFGGLAWYHMIISQVYRSPFVNLLKQIKWSTIYCVYRISLPCKTVHICLQGIQWYCECFHLTATSIHQGFHSDCKCMKVLPGILFAFHLFHYSYMCSHSLYCMSPIALFVHGSFYLHLATPSFKPPL